MVPKHVVLHLINSTTKSMWAFLMKRFNALEDKKTLLEEDLLVVKKRQKLHDNKEALEKALIALEDIHPECLNTSWDPDMSSMSEDFAYKNNYAPLFKSTSEAPKVSRFQMDTDTSSPPKRSQRNIKKDSPKRNSNFELPKKYNDSFNKKPSDKEDSKSETDPFLEDEYLDC